MLTLQYSLNDKFSVDSMLDYVLHHLYKLPQHKMLNTVSAIAQRNSCEQFIYNGQFFGNKNAHSVVLMEDLHLEFDKVLTQFNRYDREYKTIRAFLLRASLNDEDVQPFIPKELNGDGEPSDIPEIRIMYSRLLKNKLLE